MNQRKAILNHLLSGKSITPLEALEKYGCFRLGARIYDLKRQGYDIENNGEKFAEYKLVKEPKQLEFVSGALETVNEP